MTNPYRRAAEALNREKRKPEPRARKPVVEAGDPLPMQVVGKKYVDPQSLADEQYMTMAQRRINERLARGAQQLSDELRKRKGFGLKRP